MNLQAASSNFQDKEKFRQLEKLIVDRFGLSYLLLWMARVEACNRQEKFIIVDRLRLSHLLSMMGKGGGL